MAKDIEIDTDLIRIIVTLNPKTSSVAVGGPINNELLCLRMLSNAQTQIVDRAARLRLEKAQASETNDAQGEPEKDPSENSPAAAS